MLTLIREYSLDVWDWIVGNRYPRQEQLELIKPRREPLLDWIKEPDPRFPAPVMETRLIKMGGNFGAVLKAETKLMCGFKLMRQPSLIGVWEETHPESSVCITQLKPQPRILPAYQSEHEEF